MGRRPPYYRLSTSDFGPPCSARVLRERPVYSLSERQARIYWYHFYHVFGMTRPRIDPDLPQPNQTLYRGGKLSGKHQMASQKYPASAEDRTHDRRIDSSARYHCAIAPLISLCKNFKLGHYFYTIKATVIKLHTPLHYYQAYTSTKSHNSKKHFYEITFLCNNFNSRALAPACGALVNLLP